MKKQNKKTFSPNNLPRSRGRPPEHPTQELETTRVPSPNSLPRAGDQIPLSAGSRKTTRRSTTLPCHRDHPKNTPIEPEGHHDPCPIQYHAAGSQKLLSAMWPTDSSSTRCQNNDAHHSAVPPPPGSNQTGTRPLVRSTSATQQPQRPTSLWEFDLAQHREVITPRRNICATFLN